MSSSTDASAGQVLASPRDRYTLLEPIGRGGFGVTWQARRESDGAVVVVKQLRMERVGDWKSVELFEREGHVLGALRHAAIPGYLDSFALGEPSAPTGFVLVQSYVAGPTLQQLLERGQPLGAVAMFNWFWRVLEVCSYLHGQHPPVIHRDISPKNIILRDVGVGDAVLIDFGTVQAALVSATAISSTAAGTFGYAPPEQFVGRATPSSDLYGLAMSYLAVTAGRPPERMPFQGHRVDVAAVLASSATDPRLRMVLSEMTEPDPARRPQSADAVMQRLMPLRRTLESAPAAPAASGGAEPGGDEGGEVATMMLDAGALEAKYQEMMQQGLGGGGGAAAAVPAARSGGDPALDGSDEVRPWLEARARLAALAGTPLWARAAGVPLAELERAIIDDAGTRALLIGYQGCWLLDLEQMQVELLVRDSRSSRFGAFSADGTHAVIGDYYAQALYLVTIPPSGTGPAQVRTVRLAELETLSSDCHIAVSPDHALIALAKEDRWDSDSPDPLLLVDWASGSVVDRPRASCSRGLSFSADGRHLLCSGESMLVILDTSGQHAQVGCRYSALSPDGTRLAIVDRETREGVCIGTVRSLVPLQWTQGAVVKPLGERRGEVDALRWSPDGRQLLARWDDGEDEEHVLVLDGASGALQYRVAAPFESRLGMDDVHHFALSSDGRRLLIHAYSTSSRWSGTETRVLLCWSVQGERPSYLGALMMADRQAGSVGLIVNGRQVSAQEAGAMGFTVEGDDEHPPEVAEALARFAYAEDDPAPAEVPFGRTSSGFFGRLDAARSLGAPGFVGPWERQDVVAGTLWGLEEDARLDEPERAQRADLVQRAEYFFALHQSGRIHARDEVGTLVDATRGLTHLLPAVLERAEAEARNRPRFGGGGDEVGQGPLATPALLAACESLRRMDEDEREVVFEEMLERRRELARERAAAQQRAAQQPARGARTAGGGMRQGSVAARPGGGGMVSGGAAVAPVAGADASGGGSRVMVFAIVLLMVLAVAAGTAIALLM